MGEGRGVPGCATAFSPQSAPEGQRCGLFSHPFSTRSSPSPCEVGRGSPSAPGPFALPWFDALPHTRCEELCTSPCAASTEGAGATSPPASSQLL